VQAIQKDQGGDNKGQKRTIGRSCRTGVGWREAREALNESGTHGPAKGHVESKKEVDENIMQTAQYKPLSNNSLDWYVEPKNTTVKN
jgi:uncharacterized protein HemY